MARKPFGRRVGVELWTSRPSAAPPAIVALPGGAVDASGTSRKSLASSEIGSTGDDELRDWKRARRQGYPIPWRPLSLMASLCFGVAAFVLPDALNDALDWLLYGLMVASFVAGIRRRRESG